MPVECNCNTRLRVRSGFITADPNFYYRSFSFWFLWFLTTFVCVQLYKTKRERKKNSSFHYQVAAKWPTCAIDLLTGISCWDADGRPVLLKSSEGLIVLFMLLIDSIPLVSSTWFVYWSRRFALAFPSVFFLGVANGVDEGFLLRTTGFWKVLVVSCIQSGENLGTFGDS